MGKSRNDRNRSNSNSDFRMRRNERPKYVKNKKNYNVKDETVEFLPKSNHYLTDLELYDGFGVDRAAE